ncbi:MAG: nuclear pore complex protein Nup98-Nup96, partial [Halothiobacillaceae bacterium]
GLWITATVSAPAILASNIFGGPGSSNDYGLYINGGTLGSSTLSQLTLTAGSFGIGSGEIGIYINGSVVSGSEGVVTVVGLGGGLYSNSGINNYGVYLNSATVTGGTSVTLTGIGGVGTAGFHHGVVCNSLTAGTPTLTFLNCSGGQGGSNNYGVDFLGNLTMVSGALQFTNVVGGGPVANNYGIYIESTSTVRAPTILGADIVGGPGVGSNIGLYLSGTLIGSQVRMSCGSLGLGGSEYGIYSNGTVSATTFTLTGAGGGLYSSSSSGNYGIYLQGATLTGTTVTLTGLGGVGTQGFHHGVVVDTVAANTSSLIFLNCTGGTGAVGSNYGVNFVSNLTLVSGLLQFSNITGGAPGPTNYGIYIAGTVTAPTILGADIYGGPGINNNYGLYIHGGTLGSSATNQIRISAGSIGLGLSEIGLLIDSSGSATVGSGGTLSLMGTGGGLYNSAVSGNYGLSINTGSVSGTTIALTGVGGSGISGGHYGVDLESATLTAGTGGTSTNTITISGTGGVGVGGGNYGVYTATLLSVNLNGTGNGDTFTFLNCTGGTSGANNYGVNLTTGLALTHGTLQFTNIAGGGTTTSNYGVLITSTVQAPIILCEDIYGGPGTLLNHGLYIQGGTLGGAGTSFISVSAGSIGMGGHNYGIAIDTAGTVQANSMVLMGTGGGFYNGSGLQNYGIFLDSALLTATTTATLTGIGGVGSGGFNDGVAVNAVAFSGTTLIFQNCSGGTGGNQNNGVDFIGNLSLVTGLLQFNNIAGGGSGTATQNDGVYIPSGVTVSAPIILGTDLLGGPGTNNNVGLHIAGTLGSSTTNKLYMNAGSLGQGSQEYGIYLDSGSALVSNGGTLELIGAGGGLYITSGSNNHGIELSGATLTAGNGGAATNIILLTGIGGAGEGSGHCGVNIENGFTANLNGTSNGDALTFQNCVGGLGSNNNIGVYVTATGATTLNRGTLYFTHISGGSNPTSTYNDGVRIVSTVVATNIIGHDLYGGAGSSNDVGLNINGGSLGNSGTQRVSIGAGSMGLGSNEVGIYILNGSVQATILELTGSGGGLYSASGSRNIGILLSAASLTGTNSSTLTGIGGTGTGGTHHGVEINTSFSATSSALTFIHCAGGIGGNNNVGINFITNLNLASGALVFRDIVGGSSLLNNYGLYISGTVTAPTIQLTDILGGPGNGSNYGFYLNGGTLGSTAESYLPVSAGSLGLGSNEIGIYLAGTVNCSSNGTILLQGTGGGFYSGSGSGNIGVVIAAATL